MARKSILPPPGDDDNAHDGPGDAAEPDPAGTPGAFDFDPDKLEAPATPAHDPYDPAFLALPQDFAGAAQVKRVYDSIKVEKPTKERVFRTHPRLVLHRLLLLTLKEEREVYVVVPALAAALSSSPLCNICDLFPCVTKAGTPFLWPVTLAGLDGRWNPWHQTAWDIAQRAKDRWTRMESNMEAGCYVAVCDQRPPELQQPPDWPDMPLNDWLRIAFRNHTIDGLDHPVLRRLRLED